MLDHVTRCRRALFIGLRQSVAQSFSIAVGITVNDQDIRHIKAPVLLTAKLRTPHQTPL